MATKISYTLGLYICMVIWVVVVSKKVQLVNNGYEGVTIAISAKVQESDALLQHMEEYLTDASAALFQATRNHVYFREFRIVIPKEWSTNQTYGNALDNDVDTASIVIDSPDVRYGDHPYVKQIGERGTPGLYIHFTPGYFLEDDALERFGPPGKRIFEEWATLRWGISDERPVDDSDGVDYGYNDFWPIQCNEEVNKTSNSTECDKNSSQQKLGICPFDTELSESEAEVAWVQSEYLENDLHTCAVPIPAPMDVEIESNTPPTTTMAPTRQLKLCAYQVAREILKRHPEFAELEKNGALPSDTNTKPKFRYVQARPKRRVLVLDTSGSMDGPPLIFLRQAAVNFIRTTVEDGSQLGIVQFESVSSVLAQLREVNSENDRSDLVDTLQIIAGGGTCIGCGLNKAKELLTTNSNNIGGSIILVTDGMEYESPMIADVKPALLEAGITVHTLAFTQSADMQLESLSRDTGGRSFFYSGQSYSTALMDALAAIVAGNTRLSNPNAPLSIVTDAGVVRNNIPMTGTFVIDNTIGKDTTLSIGYDNEVEVELQGPSTNYSSVGNADLFKSDQASNTLKMMIPGEAETGTWTYNISSRVGSQVTMSIQSKIRYPDIDVIQVTSWIPEQEDIAYTSTVTFGIYAEILRGRAPVLNAHVVATIERPYPALPIEIVLRDNGAGVDLFKDDGIYGASVIAGDLVGNGRYNIKIKGIGSEGQTRVMVNGGQNDSKSVLETSKYPLKTQTAPLGSFERLAANKEIIMKNVVDPSTALDSMPPARITDLIVTSFDLESHMVALQWTAVGDDDMRETAAKYEIHTSHDFGKLVFETDNSYTVTQDSVLKGNLSLPQPPGTLEEFELNTTLLGDDRTIFIGIIGIDHNNNTGKLSNLVSICAPRTLALTSEVQSEEIDTFPFVIMALLAVTMLLGGMFVIHRSRWRRSMTVNKKSTWSWDSMRGPWGCMKTKSELPGSY